MWFIAFIVVYYSGVESFQLVCTVRIYEVSEPTLWARVQCEHMERANQIVSPCSQNQLLYYAEIHMYVSCDWMNHENLPELH